MPKGIVEFLLKHQWMLLAFACVVLGVYCSWLNVCLYDTKAPFFDSMGYHEKMFRVMWLTQNVSVAEAISDAVHGHNTVFLPYLFGIVASFFVEPTRLLFIWFQVVELFLFCWTANRYCAEVRGLDPLHRFLASFAILALVCLYFDNGGLSDFRMDLSQMLMYGATCLSYLIARHSGSWRSFLILGGLASWCLLIRATSPVFLLASCLPMLVVDVLKSQGKFQLLLKSATAILLTLILTGWYFVANFDYLKFYYLEWNTDANARLSVWDSLGHLERVKRGIGEPFLALVLVWIGLAVTRVRQQGRRSGKTLGLRFRDLIDWRMLWIGFAPLGVLIGMGAGLNPFVGLLAIPGLALLILIGLTTLFQDCPQRGGSRWILISLGAAILGAGLWGFKNHNDTKFNSMAAQQEVIARIQTDVQNRKTRQARFAVTFLGSTNTTSLMSILRYDIANATQYFESTAIDDVEFVPDHLFAIASVADWKSLNGLTDDQKLSALLRRADRTLDYLVVPTAEMAELATNRIQGTHINKFAKKIRNRVSQSSDWVQIGSAIQTGKNEAIEIYRRRSTQSQQRLGQQID